MAQHFYVHPYRLVEDTATFESYETNPLYPWWQVATLIALLYGFVSSSTTALVLSGISWVFYLFASLALGAPIANKIQRASGSSLVNVSGSKFSFSDPSIIRIPKNPSIDPNLTEDLVRSKLLSRFGANRVVLLFALVLTLFLIASQM